MRAMVWTAVAGAVVSWVAAPWVSLARHGTIDQRTTAAWAREEPRPRPDIPAPRQAAERHAGWHTAS